MQHVNSGLEFKVPVTWIVCRSDGRDEGTVKVKAYSALDAAREAGERLHASSPLLSGLGWPSQTDVYVRLEHATRGDHYRVQSCWEVSTTVRAIRPGEAGL